MKNGTKFQTQFSQKLQRFRRYRKNKKCSIHELSDEYQQNMATFFPLDWSFKEKLLHIPCHPKHSNTGCSGGANTSLALHQVGS
jgi:hypothetical protein